MNQIIVRLSPSEAANVVYEFVNNAGITTECVASYNNISQDGREVVFLVFEKYYMRNSSRASLSVVFENINGQTVVGYSGSGGGESAIFKFDWGAKDNFANLVMEALGNYRIG
jgi:hypothetical protein